MDRESELALVTRLRDGDAAAFDEVYAAFNRRLLAFLTRLSRSRDVAEDLVEETWLRLVAHAGRLRPDTQLGPWLYTVARNLYLSYCRSRVIEESVDGRLMGLWPAGAEQPSPFEETAASEAERKIEHALATLPAIYREAVLLVGVEGMKPSEAATICGITAEAMRQRLSRARALLAERIEDIGALPAAAFGEVLL